MISRKPDAKVRDQSPGLTGDSLVGELNAFILVCQTKDFQACTALEVSVVRQADGQPERPGRLGRPGIMRPRKPCRAAVLSSSSWQGQSRVPGRTSWDSLLYPCAESSSRPALASVCLPGRADPAQSCERSERLLELFNLDVLVLRQLLQRLDLSSA